MHPRPIPAPLAQAAVPDRRRGKDAEIVSRLLAWFLTVGVAVHLSQPLAAQLASKSAAEWLKTLESNNRIVRLGIDETIAKLKIRPGAAIANIGAGSERFIPPLAKAAVPTRKVYAVDI